MKTETHEMSAQFHAGLRLIELHPAAFLLMFLLGVLLTVAFFLIRRSRRP